MDTEINNEIDALRTKFHNDKIENMIKNTNDEEIINILKKEIINNEPKIIVEPIKKVENIFNETQYNINFKKPWGRLPDIHKIKKVQEYINSLEDCNNKPEIIKQLTNAINHRILSKNNFVTYNINEQKIVSIKNLKNNNGIYKI